MKPAFRRGDSLGVDLVEIKKARRFYARHRAKLSEILTESEIMFCRRAKKPYERLAALLASKEAVFKALSRSPKSFTEIELCPDGYGRFKTASAFSKKTCRVRYRKNARFVLADCYLKRRT